MKLFLFLFALLATASGLRIFVGTARATTARACAANMALPKIDDARSLSTEEIEAEIATAKKVRDRALSRGGAINPFFISPRSVLTSSRSLSLSFQQELFELRKKVKTRQQVKPHLFTHTKHRIGQLQTLLSQRAA